MKPHEKMQIDSENLFNRAVKRMFTDFCCAVMNKARNPNVKSLIEFSIQYMDNSLFDECYNAFHKYTHDENGRIKSSAPGIYFNSEFFDEYHKLSSRMVNLISLLISCYKLKMIRSGLDIRTMEKAIDAQRNI